MSTTTFIRVPEGGTKVVPGEPTPDHPIVPFIEGDGTGPDIWRASVRVFDAAVAKAYGGRRQVAWCEVLDGSPVAGVEGVLRPRARRPEQLVVPVEALEQGVRDPLCPVHSGGR